MKKGIMVLSTLLILLPFSVTFAGGIHFGYSAALAQDEAPDSAGEATTDDGKSIIPKLSGEITTSGVIAGVNGSKAKFNEYRDTETGIYGGAKLRYDDDNYWLKFKSSDMGYDTQNYKLEGGIYGGVKYFMEYNEIPHNWNDGAKTIYNGVGSNTLTLPSSDFLTNSAGARTFAPPANSWKTFDYSIKRKQEGGGVRLDLLKPFYIEFSGNREERSGIRPNTITYTGTSGFGGPIAELPTPVSYVTNVFKGEAGYITKPLFASVNAMYTDFNNAYESMSFQNGNSQMDVTTLPPSDQSYRYGFKGSVALPLNTRLNVNLSDSDTRSNADLLTSYMTNTNAGTAAAPNYLTTIKYANGATVWNGNVRTQSYSFVLTSNPISFLNTNIFYKYYNKDNRSDEITITTPTGNSASPNDLISYHKNDCGVNLRFRLPEHFILTGGYEYLQIDRSFAELPETKDNLYSVGLKWNGVNFMLIKIGYDRLSRDGNVNSAVANANGNTFMISDPRIDAGSQNRDIFKGGIDFYPMDNLGFGILYKYKKSVYPDNALGLQNTKKDEVTLDVDYAFAKFAKVNAYIEYENERLYQLEHVGTPVTPAFFATETNSVYNYSIGQRDRTYNFGAGLDIYVIPKKMTVRVQYDYVNSNGFEDYTLFSPAYLGLGTALPNPGMSVRNNDSIDNPSWDDYRKSALMVKSTFNVSKAFTVALGYSYDRFKYSDASIDNYAYTIVGNSSASNGAGTSGTVSYLTGAYANPSYNASTVFLACTYRF
ncbi:MAG: MtrB/PioB family outer membrane beta-barrel protein [Nitrospirae bacterium]|nr:MtrB/PioB family outer membrane beta-barrel protein [Nitrospirota bacterium]MBF0591379.1 MtrB/PioB family outer membrane beta-barrel protein [Nitrospirota bacterium]